jgi:glycosyltransferase involved in cell wall biosynthesis
MIEQKKRVVFVSESLPLGGTSIFAINVCSGLRDSGGWSGVAAGLRGLGEVGPQIRARDLECLVPENSAVLHEQRIEDLYRQCARIAPRAVVAALSGGSFDFLRVVPDGCLRIGMIQSDDEGVYRLVTRYLPWLDAVAGVSREICRKMEARLGDRRIPVVHQPYGVPMPPVVTPRSGSGTLRVLYLGRVIEEQKRVSMMARIMKASLQSGADLEWTIAGDGPDLESLEAQFTGTGKVRFLGSIPYQNVPRILAEHDVYFLCSDYEGLPLSLLEAMGEGLIPVVSDLPSGISEVVNEGTGIRVGIHDEAGFVTALTDLAGDGIRRAALSAGAAEGVRQSHSTQAMARRWTTMLDDLLPENIPAWKPACHATAPLELQGKWLYHPALRPIRIMGKNFKQWAGR